MLIPDISCTLFVVFIGYILRVLIFCSGRGSKKAAETDSCDGYLQLFIQAGRTQFPFRHTRCSAADEFFYNG
jgi:hypothetical protein